MYAIRSYYALDLDGKYLTSEGRNFVASYENTLEDLTGHGTHVAGTAAAECNNNEGVAGVACEASVVSLKVCRITSYNVCYTKLLRNLTVV